MKNTKHEIAKEIVEESRYLGYIPHDIHSVEYGAMKMAERKDQQAMELWNVVRNVYEAWMGGTMNDVRECMKDLGHVYDKFKDKGMY